MASRKQAFGLTIDSSVEILTMKITQNKAFYFGLREQVFHFSSTKYNMQCFSLIFLMETLDFQLQDMGDMGFHYGQLQTFRKC